MLLNCRNQSLSNKKQKKKILQISALALSATAADYTAPIWRSSSHTKQVDVAMNETTGIITGGL